ncbi:MAG: hypothetical protein OXH56_15080 [Gemmatimonadetes bacterium]|nr:hypothetical protein [Gemmatimonadota bacterium]
MTKILLLATAAVWWSMAAGSVHSPPTANAQVSARGADQVNARAAHQTDAQIATQVTEHRLTLFHTNDLRGNIYSEDGLGDTDPAGNLDPGNAAYLGGLAALVSMIRVHEGAGVPTLVLDGGNAMDATPACDVDGCRTLFQLMNMAEYDAMALGGLEFTYGLDTLATRVGQADFPMLSANLEFGDTVDGNGNAVDENEDEVGGTADTIRDSIAPFLLTERSGLQIAVMGLVSSRMADDLSSVGLAALDIQDPRETLESLLAGPAGRADVRIALVNMSMDEARDLALSFPQVQLFIAGGTAAGPEPRPAEHVVRFVDGRYLVTTPGRGTHLGRLEITFRREGGMTSISYLSPVLVPAGSSALPDLATTPDSSDSSDPAGTDPVAPAPTPAPLDPGVSAVVAGHMETVREVYDVRIGQTRAPIEDTGSWIADLARTRLAADVAAIDRHALRPVPLDGEIRLRSVTRLVRDDDVLVRIAVSGRQLRAWAGRLPREHDVVFAGYDAVSGAVDGQPLNLARTYVVAMPMMLADPDLTQRARNARKLNDPGTRIGLRQLVTTHVRLRGSVDRWEGIRRGPRSVMEGSTRLNGSLSQTTLEGPADQYSRDPFLSGEESLAWLVRVEHQSTRYTPAGSFSAQLRTGYGRLNNNGSQREAVDRIDGELLYSLPSSPLSPFLGLDVNTVWTGGEGQKHPVVLRFKGGLQTDLGSQAIVRVGLALERDRITAVNVVGVELAPEYRTTLLEGNTLESQARVFWGTGQRQTMSVQHYNHLRFRLLDDLSATLDANLFLHRDSDVDRAAVKFELQVGLGYDWRYYR